MAQQYISKNDKLPKYSENMFMSPGTKAPEYILKKYPKTHFLVAEIDTLRDMSFLFLDKLLNYGVNAKLTEILGLHHGCISMGLYEDFVI